MYLFRKEFTKLDISWNAQFPQGGRGVSKKYHMEVAVETWEQD